MNALPIFVYRGKNYFVDFRMGELRSVKTARAIKFEDLPEKKDSRVKSELRALRFRTYSNEYIYGLDDDPVKVKSYTRGS